MATVAIEAMRFLRPVEVGDEVSCFCTLEKAGDTSMAVRIETWARGRGWALWKGLIMITNTPPGQAEFARRVLAELFAGV